MRTMPASKNDKLTYLPGARQAVSAKRRFVPVLVILVVLYFVMLFAGQYLRLLQLRGALAVIEADIRAVKQQNEAMLQEIERLHSPAYLEQTAREELGMVRSGELLFYFRDTDNLPASVR